MIWLIAAFVIFGVGFWLYTIGRKTKEQEKEFVKQIKRHKRHSRFMKYSRKHYAKVPSNARRNNKKTNK